MKKLRNIILFTSVFFLFAGCKKDEDDDSTLIPTIPTESISSDKRADAGGSGVMIQGFTWSSPNSAGSWYDCIINNASEIKDLFEYVWFPPASDCTDTNGNGYLPRELNLLTQKYPEKINYYGTEEKLFSAINAIKPAGAIEDVVINHRCGTTNWGDFTNPSWEKDFASICRDDEGFSNASSGMKGAKYKGALDTGAGYEAARDIDHSNTNVQDGIILWMNDILKTKAGFVGWRYDYVRGYSGKYVGYYNSKTEPKFSVGEFWPSSGFIENSPTWTNLIIEWIKTTAEANRAVAGKPSRAFDFVLKGNLNSVFGTSKGTSNKNYQNLASEYNIYKKLPGYSVTFVENHDTGSTQNKWELDADDIAAAYALILTHPGYPCIAWYHYFSADDCIQDTNKTQYIGGETVPGSTLTYKNFIKELVQLRAALKITDLSKVDVIQADTTRYSAEVKGDTGTAYVVIGTALESAPAGFTAVVSGTGFQVFKK